MTSRLILAVISLLALTATLDETISAWRCGVQGAVVRNVLPVAACAAVVVIAVVG